MTLDEAIKHAEEVADTCEYEASKYDMSDSYECHVACQEGKCAEEHRQLAEWLKDYKRLLKQEPCDDIGEVSDGYHTFNQLYHQRAVLFATIVNQNKDKSWKSFKHSDGNYCFDSNGEWFIVGIDTPQGSYTYHYAKEYWDMFDCEELECGKEWDGHTEEDVTRLLSLKQEPSGDAVSRQAVLDYIHRILNQGTGKKKSFEFIQKYVEKLSSVNPQLMMRDATPEEQKSVDDYIKSISKPTGINFWNLDDNDDCISRKAVLSLLADHFDNVFDMVKELPSVAILPEHDGCKDCKYETYPEYYYPCCECKQNYVDEWQKKPHWIHRNDDYTDWLECPNCGYGSEGEVKYGEGTPFCPHCGERLEEK